MNRLDTSNRSGAEWAARVLASIVIAVIGYAAFTRSIADTLKKSDPNRAYAMSAADGRITASLSESLFQDRPSGGRDSASAKLARLAVKQDATAVSAVVILAAQAQLRGDARETRRMFGYAETLSRRNLMTQLWAIEDAVSRGDISGALRHYDIALRVSRSASTILYPILAAALADPAIQSGLTAIMVKKPAWGPSFLAYALGSSADPRQVASLFMNMRSAGAPIAPEASSSLIDRLLLLNAPDDAWRYYASLQNGLARDRARDGRFMMNPASSSQFDWTAENVDGAAVSIQRDRQGGIVDFSVPTGHAGVLLRQVQMLPVGTYRLSGTAVGIDQPDASMPYWTLTCRDGRELGRAIVSRSRQGVNSFASRFDIPSDCPVQTLAFVARPANGVTGVSGRINSVELRRIN
jgi:hypothetical protein